MLVVVLVVVSVAPEVVEGAQSVPKAGQPRVEGRGVAVAVSTQRLQGLVIDVPLPMSG